MPFGFSIDLFNTSVLSELHQAIANFLNKCKFHYIWFDSFMTKTNIIETSPLICCANQLIGFYIITACVMKELRIVTTCVEQLSIDSLTFYCWKIGKSTSKILHCEHCKILKVWSFFNVTHDRVKCFIFYTPWSIEM